MNILKAFMILSIIEILKNKEEYKRFYENRKKFAKKADNFEGSFISIILQEIESNIIMNAIDFFDKNRFKISAYMFDGLLLRKNDKLDDKLLEYLSKYIIETSGYSAKFTYKKMEYPEYFNDLEEPSTKFLESIKKLEIFQYMTHFFTNNSKNIVYDGETTWFVTIYIFRID